MNLKLKGISQQTFNTQQLNALPLIVRRQLVASGKATIVKVFPYTIQLNTNNGLLSKKPDDTAGVIIDKITPNPTNTLGAKAVANKMRGKSQFKEPKIFEIPCCI